MNKKNRLHPLKSRIEGWKKVFVQYVLKYGVYRYKDYRIFVEDFEVYYVNKRKKYIIFPLLIRYCHTYYYNWDYPAEEEREEKYYYK